MQCCSCSYRGSGHGSDGWLDHRRPHNCSHARRYLHSLHLGQKSRFPTCTCRVVNRWDEPLCYWEPGDTPRVAVPGSPWFIHQEHMRRKRFSRGL
jgi:hypothetical protein